MTQNKKLSFCTSLIWSLHPTNIEFVIWATNWVSLIASSIYFYTLYKLITFLENNLINQKSWFLIFLLTLIQISIVEYSISIPLVIFFTAYIYLKNKDSSFNAIKTAVNISAPSFIAVIIYLIVRFTLADDSLRSNSGVLFERLSYLTPQIFFHLLKLVFYPIQLTIDQSDLLNLDNNIGGTYHLFCISGLIIFISLIIGFFKFLPYFSLGLILYIVGVSPFLQVIPLYSVVAERYNYFGSAFLIFGVLYFLFHYIKNKKILISLIIILSVLITWRTYDRITDWKDSKTLFFSTVNSSKSLLKKGIWTYNLALAQGDKNKKDNLLELSTNFLKLFITHHKINTKPAVLKTYELDDNSLLAKAAYRAAINFELLNQKESQLEYLNLALKYANPKSKIQSLIYKDFGTHFFQTNNFKKAIEYYEKSDEILPSPTINYGIAVCYLKLNDIGNYEKYLKLVVSEISAYNAAPFKTYAQFLEYNKNDLNNATYYYKIATLLENNPEPYILLSTVLLKQIKIDEALKYVKRGLHSFPENPSLIYLRGTILLNKGKTQEGINDLKKVAVIDGSPDDIQIEASNILVNIFLNKKNTDEAIKYNEIALMIDPKNLEALKYKNLLMVR